MSLTLKQRDSHSELSGILGAVQYAVGTKKEHSCMSYVERP
jgi:hypothetical protein